MEKPQRVREDKAPRAAWLAQQGGVIAHLGTAPSTMRLAFCLLFPMTAFFMSLNEKRDKGKNTWRQHWEKVKDQPTAPSNVTP